MVNIIRVPHAGRNFETFSEDPFLTSRLGAQEVKGIEGEGMIAATKHFLANNFEEGRDRISVELDERTLREIYFPGFRSAVAAGTGSVMAAYNRVNGTYACDNERLLSDLLKRELGFEGWIMTDWYARHSLGAIQAGLDMERPGLDFPGAPQAVYFGESLRAAVETGRIAEREVDRSVRRILRQMQRKDLLGDPPPRPSMDLEKGATVARDVAVSGAVLLKNDEQMLPLELEGGTSVAVVGPTAQRPLYGGGGSSEVIPSDGDVPLEAFRRRLGDEVDVRYEPGLDLDGVPVPSSALAPSKHISIDGLRRSTDDGAIEIDSAIDFTGENALPGASRWAWSGILTAPETGTYDLKLQTKGGGGTLFVNGEERTATRGFYNEAGLIPTDEGLHSATAQIEMTEGETCEIRVTVEEGERGFVASNGVPVQVRLAWVPPSRREAFRTRAVEAARAADATVVFGYNEGKEGTDRSSLFLPARQNALIRSVADASASTTVVLNTGDPVRMPWLENVESVLEMWYPGQHGGDATAALLTGDAAPGGRLPVTFPRREQDAPTHPKKRYPGVNGRVHYSEGIFVGYRWYDENDIEPLFPFGHGLTYTRWAYSDLSVRAIGRGYEVQFRVENVGKRTGTVVPQVYVGRPPDPPVPMPPKELAGFERLELAPGEATTVSIPVENRAFSYWSTEHDEWRIASGHRPIYVGTSSRELLLEQEVRVG
jgi:beta-glucosidase